MSIDLDALHADAVARRAHRYRDPATGYRVFTALGLEARGECCGAGCRHCPYAHEWVPAVLRGDLVQDPWLRGVEAGDTPLDLLLWSGGKDAFLALVALARAGAREVALLTTFDGRSHRVGRRGLGLADVAVQAEALGIGLVGVPLYPERPWAGRVALALRRVAARRPVARVVSGDLSLRHARSWREGRFGPAAEAIGAPLHFPLWDVDPTELEAMLWRSGAVVTVSAVADARLRGRVSVGDRVDAAWMDALPDGVDRMGENGEYHTRVQPPAVGWRALGA